MINVLDLSKKFSDKIVIDKLNLFVNSGEIVALVGKNGAGKSTLIRLISGLLKADSGKFEFAENARIGVLLGGDINLYGNLSGYEVIHYFGKLYGIDTKTIDKKIDDLDKELNFKSFFKNRTATFSRGMRQKIAIVISVIHEPDILLLDEPSTGLDIEASNDVIKFIEYLKKQNKTILIATHNIFEISDLSDRIAFIDNGKIIQTVDTKQYFKGCTQGEKSKKLILSMEGTKT